MAPQDYAFEVEMTADRDPQHTLLVGLSNIGMAGLTTADYLVRNSDAEQIGYISPDDLPAITPFADGEPRHHTRVYRIPDSDVTVLLGELFIPVAAAKSFTADLLDWATSAGIENIAVLNGVPYPHAPDKHDVFHVATPAYRNQYVEETDIDPLTGGFLDGVAGELMTRGLEDAFPPVGVFVTPTHPPGPDIDAALRFLDVLQAVYDLSVDRTELAQLAGEVQQYYAELADRIQALDDSAQSVASQEYPEDRMFY